MKTGGSVRRNLSVTAVGLIMGFDVVAMAAAGKAPTHIQFARGSYELTSDASAHLETLVKELKAEPSLAVVISEATFGLKKGSLPYIVERNRVLRLFQTLVREGIDPARISYVQVKQTAKATDVGIETRTVNPPPKTEALKVAADGASANQPGDFVVNFPSASAEPANLSEERFREFLTTVGQPGHDAVVIEGYTDSVGNAAYNMALGELRALSVYERLIRAGLPPYRIDTKSLGMTSANRGAAKGGSEADRRVVMRWTKNAEAAAEAAKVEEPAKKPEPVKEEPAKPVAAEPAPEPKKDEGSLFDIVPFAGVLMPGGELKDHAKSALNFGLGIGKAFLVSPAGELRATLFASANSKLEAKESDRKGTLKVRFVNIRGDYAFGAGPVRPFVGFGLGVYTWDGSITQKSTSQRNSDSKNDMGGNATIGLDFVLSPSFFLSPELSWHRVGGKFSETLYSGVVAARWRI